MRATGINHLSISARDIEESVRFYEEVFGMERVPTYNFGFRTQYLRCGSQQIHVFHLPEETPTYQHFALDVDDFHATYDEAKRRGILDSATFGNAVNELPDGSVQMYVRDPGGNLVEANWPDINTLDRARIPDLRPLAERFQQTGENLEATLYLDRKASNAS